MDDEPTPGDLEQLARSLAMSGSLREHDRQVVAEGVTTPGRDRTGEAPASGGASPG